MISDMEKKLIISLRRNARHKIKDIAHEHNLPISTVAYLLHKLEDDNLIHHKTHVAFEKLGYNHMIFVALKTDSSNRTRLREYLEQSKNINTLCVINSGYDFHLEAVFRNQGEAKEFIEDIHEKHNILEKNIYNIINKLHSEKFLTTEEHFKEV